MTARIDIVSSTMGCDRTESPSFTLTVLMKPNDNDGPEEASKCGLVEGGLGKQGLKRGGIPGRVKNMTAEEVAAEITRLENEIANTTYTRENRHRGRLQTRLHYLRTAEDRRAAKRLKDKIGRQQAAKALSAMSKGWRGQQLSDSTMRLNSLFAK